MKESCFIAYYSKGRKEREGDQPARIVFNAHRDKIVRCWAQASHALRWSGQHPGVGGVHLQELVDLIPEPGPQGMQEEGWDR